MEVEPGTGIDFEGDTRDLYYGVTACVVWSNYVRKLSRSVVRFKLCTLRAAIRVPPEHKSGSYNVSLHHTVRNASIKLLSLEEKQYRFIEKDGRDLKPL